uniref:Uncharacterized protein n=1 Tax=Odontella aurita TaxID=265563 RepID=A0A7S4IQI9_9STRA|mmetsp:Transcript_28747/g.84790  ORF Transcript_28747/g.84790 Transcript_28747/m.84790 type:complete len:388 (+) Transcript_28747:382-1545(+)
MFFGRALPLWLTCWAITLGGAASEWVYHAISESSEDDENKNKAYTIDVTNVVTVNYAFNGCEYCCKDLTSKSSDFDPDDYDSSDDASDEYCEDKFEGCDCEEHQRILAEGDDGDGDGDDDDGPDTLLCHEVQLETGHINHVDAHGLVSADGTGAGTSRLSYMKLVGCDQSSPSFTDFIMANLEGSEFADFVVEVWECTERDSSDCYDGRTFDYGKYQHVISYGLLGAQTMRVATHNDDSSFSRVKIDEDDRRRLGRLGRNRRGLRRLEDITVQETRRGAAFETALAYKNIHIVPQINGLFLGEDDELGQHSGNCGGDDESAPDVFGYDLGTGKTSNTEGDDCLRFRRFASRRRKLLSQPSRRMRRVLRNRRQERTLRRKLRGYKDSL